jgi:hypothetical protein
MSPLLAAAAAVDVEHEHLADLEDAFTRRFGPDIAGWPDHCRRTYLRLVEQTHRYYGQEAA